VDVLREQRAQLDFGLRLEIGDVVLERHRQNRVHSEPALDRRLRDEQIGARRHSDHHLDGRVRQERPQAVEERLDFPSRSLDRARMKVSVPGDSNDQWSGRGRGIWQNYRASDEDVLCAPFSGRGTMRTRSATAMVELFSFQCPQCRISGTAGAPRAAY
jgi:hypothetical protein